MCVLRLPLHVLNLPFVGFVAVQEKNAGDGLRLTKLEVARVLRERNEYKEKYLSLLEQVRYVYTILHLLCIILEDFFTNIKNFHVRIYVAGLVCGTFVYNS